MSRSGRAGATTPAAPPAGAGRRLLANPLVLLAGVLVLGFAVFQIVQMVRGQQRSAAVRRALLLAVAAAVQQVPPSNDELSGLLARLQKLPDHATDRELVAAQARIELARDRAERAAELFTTVASQPGATADDHRLAAAILLRRHETAAVDRATAEGLLRQCLGFAEQALEFLTGPDELLLAWLAASRLPDQARAAALRQRLEAAGADTAAGKFVALVGRFTPELPRGEVEAVRAEFSGPPPAEFEAMLVLLDLQAGRLEAAVAAAEALLRRAPGLVGSRWTAALVFHACAVGAEAASRPAWQQRRNAQLDWLLDMAPADDPRRAQWATLREQ